METGMIPILAAPHLDPGMGRIEMMAPPGLTLAEIVAMSLPMACEEELAQARVALVTDRGSLVIERRHWHAVRPRPGVRVVIRVIAGKAALRTVLAIVITVAAIATGQTWGLKFGQMLGFEKAAFAVGNAMLTTGVAVIGNLLLNAIIPPIKPDSREARNTYSISGWQNRLDPDGAVPIVLGRIRHAPPFAALSHSEIVGDDQYVRALFTFGEGPVDISEIRIGETAIDAFSDVELEIREGRASDLPQTIMPRQIAEEAVGVELTRPLPRDDLGEVVEGAPATAAPVVRTTGADAAGVSLILSFPAGMIRFDDNGRQHHEGVDVLIEQRPIDGEDWAEVTTLQIRARKLEGFYRQHGWDFPTRGRWQIRLTMLTPETVDSKIQRRTTWAALQTLRPEYPLNHGRPLALLAMRVRATHQLSGSLETVNAIAARHCLDWDHMAGDWVERATSNPASIYRHVLQSPANPGAVGDSGLDLEQLQDWHDFCRIHDLKYDRALDQAGMTLREVLAEVAAAGRATPRHDGLRWGVVIDRPADLVVDHVSARNSWGFACRRVYMDPPHAFRVGFSDASNDWKPAERLVRWPGYTGEITRTEVLALPGKTDPAEIWREARRRQYEAIHRPDSYQITQDGPARVATRGDTVRLSQPVLDTVQLAARVRSVAGSLIELDEAVPIEPGQSYGLRFRVFAGPNDTIGTSVVRLIAAAPGETRILTLEGSGPMPGRRDIVHFGRAGEETLPLVVTGVEPAQDMASILHMVDAASIIDDLLAADVVPPWSGRVGAEIDDSMLVPPAPRFVSIASGTVGTGAADRIDYLIRPGAGTVTAMLFRVYHRLAGAADWTFIDLPAANGGGSISGYAHGDAVELQARAYSMAAVPGPATAIITLTVGAGDAAIPAALDPEAIEVTTLPGGALIQFGTGDDDATARVQLYRSRAATLDRAADASGAPIEVGPLASWSLSVGDLTRSNLLAGTGWLAAGGWSIADGAASHSPGSASILAHPFSPPAARWYRLGYTVSDSTAGSVTPRLTGGSMRPADPVTSNGDHRARIRSAAGNDSFEFAADADFDGTVADVVLYYETAACLAQGIHYLWLEPQNDDGVPGPLIGPYMIDVI